MITHKHHIVPRHAGGSDDPSNLIELTIEEHAQAHLDLYKKHGDKRDLLAYRTLLGQISTAEARLELVKLPKTEQHKKKIGDAVRGEKNGMHGKTISEEHKQAISEANKVPKPSVSKNMKQRHIEGKSYTFSDGDRTKAVANRRPRKWYTNGTVNKAVCEGDPIPEGFIRGRVTGWATHPDK